MKRRLTSQYGDCAEDVCVHGDCGGHVSEGSVVLWVDIRRLWAPVLMMQMCVAQSFVLVSDCGRPLAKAGA